VRDPADVTGRDQLPGEGHRRGVPIVEPDGALHPGDPDGGGDRAGVVGGQPDRLLDPQMPAGLGDRGPDLPVQPVRRRHAHRVHPGIGEHLPPVLRGAGEPELGGGLRGATGDVVGDCDEHGDDAQGREVVTHPRVGPGVDRAHPAEADDADPHRGGTTGTRRDLDHAATSRRRGRRGQGVAATRRSAATAQRPRGRDRRGAVVHRPGTAGAGGVAVDTPPGVGVGSMGTDPGSVGPWSSRNGG
jgi:hypothetical protein